MIRKTLTILSLIGLLLSVGLWAVSLFNLWYIGGPLYSLRGGFVDGCIAFSKTDNPSIIFSQHAGWNLRGFEGFAPLWPPLYYSRPGLVTFFIPLWMPTVLFLTIFCILYLPLHRRRKRKKLGLCVKCGYDLRASKDRCPECGTAVQKNDVFCSRLESDDGNNRTHR